MVGNLFALGIEMGIHPPALNELVLCRLVILSASACAMSCLLMASCAALYMVLVVLLDVARVMLGPCCALARSFPSTSARSLHPHASQLVIEAVNYDEYNVYYDLLCSKD